MRIAVTVGLLLLVAGPVLAQGRPATCSRDLFQIDAEFHKQQRLIVSAGSADQPTQCKVWRDHLGYLAKARAIFATCQSGREREQSVAEMDSELVNYRGLIANRCGRR